MHEFEVTGNVHVKGDDSMKVCVSIKSLYNEFGEKLTHGTIKKTVQDDTEYYDLMTDCGVSCMDGESCEIAESTSDDVTLVNKNGEIDAYFVLTNEEFETACISNRTKAKIMRIIKEINGLTRTEFVAKGYSVKPVFEGATCTYYTEIDGVSMVICIDPVENAKIEVQRERSFVVDGVEVYISD